MPTALPMDVSGFVRRECPDCRRAFKTRPSKQDGRALQLRLSEAGTPSDLTETFFARRRVCPYCGGAASENDWLTSEHRAYVEELSESLASEANHLQLRLIAEKLAARTGPTYVSVRPAPAPEPPVYEPDDLDRVYLICCQEEVKLQPGWKHGVYCFKCGAKHDRGQSTVKFELPLVME
jgi:hypothetical protein